MIWAANLNENEFQVLKNPNKAGRMDEEKKGRQRKIPSPHCDLSSEDVNRVLQTQIQGKFPRVR